MNTVILIVLVVVIEIAIVGIADEIRKSYWWKKTSSSDHPYHCYYVEAQNLETGIRKQKSHLMLRLYMVERGLCHAHITQEELDELEAMIREL